mgnify:CR=1 FL=1
MQTEPISKITNEQKTRLEFQTRNFKHEKISSSTRECQKSSADRKNDTPIKIFWEKTVHWARIYHRTLVIKWIKSELTRYW